MRLRPRHLAAAGLLLAAACAGRESKDGAARSEPEGEPEAVPSHEPKQSAEQRGSKRQAKAELADGEKAEGTKTEGTKAEGTTSDAPRVYAKSRFVWIRESPEDDSWIGFLWIGGSVALKSQTPRPGFDCPTYYAVEPRGFVCVDGQKATLDANDPALASLRPYAPKLDSAWPHRYGESRELQRYETIPDAKQQRAREWDLPQHLERVAEARTGGKRHELLEGVDLSPSPERPIELLPLPSTAHEPRKRKRLNSTVAYSAEMRRGDRDWLLTADYMWVPKDRVVPYQKVEFHGVELGKQAKLPLAFFRGEDRPAFVKTDEGFREKGTLKRLSWVELTGREETLAGVVYLETRKDGLWVKQSDAVVPSPAKLTPWGAPVGGKDETGRTPKGRATWLEASVWGGWLIAYEGTRPVYATMISPGRGGTPVPGKDPLSTASTPVGTFKITGKFATATMVAPHEFIHADVPWTQNFSGPHALHGAYWHDNWGNRMSAGCVNASPIDGKWLYEFTEPEVPEGWHGVRWTPSREPATSFVVHK